MAKKAEKNSAVGADCLPGEADTRPEASPYAASNVDLQLEDGTILRIPSPLLHKHPKLPKHCGWSQTIRLDITQEVGHTLVHYLFTNTYQSLAPKGRSPHEKVAAEFATSIRVYAFARKYELFSLEELAKLEIERLGNALRFSMVLDLVRDAYPDPSADDIWFGNYLKSGLESLLRHPSELSDCVSPTAERKTLSVSDLLFKNLVELVHNHDILPLAPDPASLVGVLEESAFVMPAPELGPPEEAAPGLEDSDFPNTCEPDLEPEKKEDDDISGVYIPEKDNTKGKKAASQTVELEPESEPVQERALDPEPDESKEEDICDRLVSKKTRKVSKKTKKGKNKKLHTVELEPESESVQEPLNPEPEESKEEGMLGPKNTKDKKGKKKKKLQTLEYDLEPGNESKFCGTRWTSKLEAGLEHEPLEEVAYVEEVEAAPAVTDDWSLCESDGKETNLNATCDLRAEHVLGNG